ncbi:ketoacyl-ACP synthase III [Robertkochia marina]|uniref:Ketoacyl-ACP synthase III n=1 Tax=Robertkochia marina TaxID=1227945 RepID=A0A4S3M458_9FLAO|nr:ketoacyl-ACP synthase III [Robertkochia marina]THD69893.1 ketoacyl-ACP synthase III [Robertkochia marina]TRZ46759.1 ketoacyl-ACP synthase III [Robertkochia marina]
MNTRIKGTGCYIPSHVETNEEFGEHEFLNSDGSVFNHSNEVIIKKFSSITGIGERRYVTPEYKTSDIAYFAAERAIDNARIDKETLDYIIVAHNFGDVQHGSTQGDTLPSLAARVKNKLEIKNPKCVAYDLIFGCPGWLEGLIQAHAFIKAGLAKRCLVIGAETLSRVVDKHDRDSMIYSDGAGATVVEASNESNGILAHETASFTQEEAFFLFFGKSYKKDAADTRYIKMHGRKIYEFAITQVPKAMKACFDKTGRDIKDLKKIFIHQANEKMDEAIVDRFFRLYNTETPEKIMPMNIATLGNSSVATIPTLFDMVTRGELIGHEIKKGDCIMFASVGAGMNINAMIYEV